MLVKTLIEIAQRAARDDKAWLGSEAHRELIEEFAASRIQSVRVLWLPPGERSYTKGRLIAMERPTAGIETDETVDRHALMVLHEVLHLAYSDHAGADAFAFQLSRLAPFMQRLRLGQDLFNHLEDARIAHREHVAEPADDRYVSELHRLAIEQEEASHWRAHSESPWIPTPTHKFPQLRMALIERMLVGDRGPELDPMVANIVAEAASAISTGIASATTDGARAATLEVLDIVMRHGAELTAGLADATSINVRHDRQ